MIARPRARIGLVSAAFANRPRPESCARKLLDLAYRSSVLIPPDTDSRRMEFLFEIDYEKKKKKAIAIALRIPGSVVNFTS